MDSHILPLIFGGASLVGLFLQVLGAFSKYKEIRNGISLVIFGIFLGTIIGAVNPNSISVSLQMGWLELLLITLGTIVVFCVIATEVRENKSSDSFIGLAISAGALFFFILLFGPLVKQDNSSSITARQFSVDELMAIKDFNIERQNYDQAIFALDKIKNKLSVNDVRRNKIDEEIESIKLKQIE